MYTVSVRDHFMIAHSFSGDAFGPAQRLHGATYVVDLEFRRKELDGNGMVVDIGRAGEELRQILGGLSYRNLDDEAGFAGRNTTTEFLARVVFNTSAARPMSTTMPLASSSGRRNSRSTTYVAPWRRWAGPKASP